MENNEFLSITVEEEFKDMRLDVFVTRMCEQVPSRSFASKLISQNKIFVNQKSEKVSYKLKVNDSVSIDLSFFHEINAEPIGEKIPLNILFEDEHLIVLDKIAGMVVHPGAGVNSGTLVNAILAHCGCTLPSLGSAQRAGIVHRLDRDTSGVMVVAKSQLALTGLSKQFADHSQTRIYKALVYGAFDAQEGKIETWHGRDPRNRLKYSVQPEGIGKKAILNYKVIENILSPLFSLVECKLYTGRTHQIRVQMSNLKHGIVGDALYAQPLPQLSNQKKIQAFINQNVNRQLLHAEFLGFTHPATNQYVSFQSKLPEDFQSVLNFLRSQNAVE